MSLPPQAFSHWGSSRRARTSTHDGHAADGRWWAAKVIALHGEGADATATLTFVGFPASHNETFKDSDSAIRVHW